MSHHYILVILYNFSSGEQQQTTTTTKLVFTEDGQTFTQTQTWNSTSQILTLNVPAHSGYPSSIYMISEETVNDYKVAYLN